MISRTSRRGFSLLEVMIATAILAGSAMVLLSLISLGTRFGSKAEVRIGALVQAQSILDESILRIHSGESIENYTGVLPGSKPRSYRVSVEPFLMNDPNGLGDRMQDPNAIGATATPTPMSLNSPPIGSANAASLNGSPISAPVGPQPSELVSVKVELYDSEGAAIAGSTGSSAGVTMGARPLIELTRLVRRAPILDPNGSSSIPTSGLPGR